MKRYGLLEYSTDLRCPNYKVEITTSKKRALKFMEYELKLTYEDSVDVFKNYHHDLRKICVINEEWKKPTKAQLKKMLSEKRCGSIYDPRTTDDILADLIHKNSTEFNYDNI